MQFSQWLLETQLTVEHYPPSTRNSMLERMSTKISSLCKKRNLECRQKGEGGFPTHFLITGIGNHGQDRIRNPNVENFISAIGLKVDPCLPMNGVFYYKCNREVVATYDSNSDLLTVFFVRYFDLTH